jgi:hypothetical protein
MNPILEKAKAAVLQKVDQRLQPAIQKSVQAGEQVMYAPQTRQELIKTLGDGSDPEAIGSGIAKVLAVLFHKSGNTLPMQVGVPAATILLIEALQFIEDAGKAKVTPDMLAACTKAMGSAVLQMFGITPDKLQAMFSQAQAGQGAQPGQLPAQAPQPAGIVASAAQGGA